MRMIAAMAQETLTGEVEIPGILVDALSGPLAHGLASAKRTGAAPGCLR
jgi:hypothetical protein